MYFLCKSKMVDGRLEVFRHTLLGRCFFTHVSPLRSRPGVASIIWKCLVSMRCFANNHSAQLLFTGASLSEPHLVLSVAGSANKMCINCQQSVWATGYGFVVIFFGHTGGLQHYLGTGPGIARCVHHIVLFPNHIYTSHFACHKHCSCTIMHIISPCILQVSPDVTSLHSTRTSAY